MAVDGGCTAVSIAQGTLLLSGESNWRWGIMSLASWVFALVSLREQLSLLNFLPMGTACFAASAGTMKASLINSDLTVMMCWFWATRFPKTSNDNPGKLRRWSPEAWRQRVVQRHEPYIRLGRPWPCSGLYRSIRWNLKGCEQ